MVSFRYLRKAPVMKRLTIPACMVILVLLVPPVLATDGPSITGFSPSSGPSNGVVTVTVTGTGFDSLSLIRLNKCKLKTGGSSQAPFTGYVISKSDTSITATFDLAGKIAGDYDLSLNAPFDGHEAWAVAPASFIVYTSSGSTPPVATTAAPVATVVTTATTVSQGENSVYFETYPPGATIHLDGEYVGTTPFMYYTSHEGTFNVDAWLSGYEKYEARVTIIEGKSVHFVAPLTVLSSGTTATTATTVTTTATTATPPVTTLTVTPVTVKNTTIHGTATTTPGTTNSTPGTTNSTPGTPNATIRRPAIPTPWPTDSPAANKSPVDPALAPCAAVLGFVLVVIRRR